MDKDIQAFAEELTRVEAVIKPKRQWPVKRRKEFERQKAAKHESGK